MVALFELFSVCLQPGMPNYFGFPRSPDFYSASQESEVIWSLDSWNRLHHTCRVSGRVVRWFYWCHFPMVAPICRSVQLPFIYLNLFPILVPSGRFSCRSQVSYHIFVCFYFTTRTRAIRLGKRKPLSIVSRRARRPISLTLGTPRPIKPGYVTAVASSAARVYYC